MATRLYQLAPPSPQVQAGWANYDGTPTIYVTSDPGLNRITFTLLNDLGDTLAIPAGTAVPPDQLPAGQGAVYVYFEGLITNPQVQGIQATFVGGGSWAQNTYPDTNGLQYLVLAPAVDVQVPDGEALTFQLTNVLASTVISGPVYVTFVGASGITQATVQTIVHVQSPPIVGNQDLDLVVGFAGSDTVFTGGQSNALTLFLTNPGTVPLVPGGTPAWGPTPPTFQLSLIFGDAQGALTTVADAVGISVDIAAEYANVWMPVAVQQQGYAPTWFLQPDPNGGGQVLGTGANASIAIGIEGIITQLPQGLTFAYLSYSGIPGYNDGFYALEIVKVDPIQITFSATPDSVPNATAGTPVSLAFTVSNATYVTVTNTTYAKPTTSASFSDTATATIYTTTIFTLLASNYATGQQLAQPLQVDVSPDPYHLVPTGTIVMWSGLQATIPNGWAICDGQTVNGVQTPDLRSRFIQGADPGQEGGTDGVGQSGPADTHTHLIDSASLAGTTGEAGAHSHTTSFNTTSTTLGGSDSIWALAATNLNAGGDNSFESSSVGNHTHSINLATPQVTSEVQDAASPMRPAWYSLYFIMKCY